MAGRYPDASKLMQLLQSCSWCPFNLNEIVTLERCLQELALSDPRFSTILRKLAHESVFVEPSRKKKYLSRTPSEERSDIILKESAAAIRLEIKQLDEEIDYYEAQLNELMESEAITREHIHKLERSILTTEESCKSSFIELEFLLERVHESLVSSVELINSKIPKFIESLRESALVKQTSELKNLYQQEISNLVEHHYQRYQQNPRLAQYTSYSYKCRAVRKLSRHLKSLCNLHRDLARLVRLYSADDIPEEIEYARAFEAHIDFLSKPPSKELPQRVVYSHEPLDDLEAPLVGVVSSPEIDRADDCGEQELSELFALLSERAKATLTSAPTEDASSTSTHCDTTLTHSSDHI